MSATKAIFMAAGVAFAILSSIATFNFYVDPMCYFHCDKVDVKRHTVNLYYQVAQKILAHPEAQVVVLGSSRGQTTPLSWLEQKTGGPVLNLSIGGAELTAKLAFLNIALAHNHLKEVIWYADYFELIPDTADAKIRSTPALRNYVIGGEGLHGMPAFINGALKLIQHGTLEASFYAVKHHADTSLDRGSGGQFNSDMCSSLAYKGEVSLRNLEKETGISYDTYSRKILQTNQSVEEWNQFLDEMKSLSAKGIDVVVVIPPYNPVFSKRLSSEYPEIYQRHLKWIGDMENLHIPHVKVANYFNGIPHDDASPRYWNDGVHFTCRGAIQMLDGQI